MRLVSSASSVNAPHTARQVVGRLLRDYVRGQWGLLFVAILAMLLAATAGGVLPWLVKLELKQTLRKEPSVLVGAAFADRLWHRRSKGHRDVPGAGDDRYPWRESRRRRPA